jgi:hypothetical protein
MHVTALQGATRRNAGFVANRTVTFVGFHAELSWLNSQRKSTVPEWQRDGSPLPSMPSRIDDALRQQHTNTLAHLPPPGL